MPSIHFFPSFFHQLLIQLFGKTLLLFYLFRFFIHLYIVSLSPPPSQVGLASNVVDTCTWEMSLDGFPVISQTFHLFLYIFLLVPFHFLLMWFVCCIDIFLTDWGNRATFQMYLYCVLVQMASWPASSNSHWLPFVVLVSWHFSQTSQDLCAELVKQQ